MNVRPVGHRVLIEPVEIQKQRGAIIIPDDVKESEQIAQVVGTVLAFGKDCWDDKKEPFCQVGDRVLYQRHSGMRLPDGKGGFRKDRLVLNDLDVICVIIPDEAEE